MRRVGLSTGTIVALVIAGVLAWLLTGRGIVPIVVAVLAGALMLKAGFAMLRSLATPLPAPPPPGELRKVKIMFRCSICGTEVRMTAANDEMPDPPRHCQEDMDLVAPVE